MMRKVFLIIVLLTKNLLFSQGSLSFYTRFGSPEDDIGNCIIQIEDSSYISLGQTNGYGANQTDILLAKNNSFGIPVWQKTYGGFGSDIGYSVVELPDSGFVFAGFTNSYGNGGYDAYFIRTDKNGNLIWQKTFGGSDWDFAYSINKTTDGNLIVCGATYSYGRGDKDGFILKLDYNGNFLWNKIYGGTKEDILKRIIQTNDGGFIATGTTKSYGDSLGDIWVTKFNSTGDSTWFKTNGGNKKEVGNSVVQDKNFDYLVTGGSESYSYGKEDAYVFKLSNAGSFVWYQHFGLATEDEESYDVLNSGSAYGNILITFGTREQNIFGCDIKTLLLDFQGGYVRGGSFGGPEDDIGYSLFNTKDKGYVACGYTESFNALEKDFFIVKYDSQMTIGPLIVSVKKLSADQFRFKIYPTLISEHVFFVDFPNKTPKPDIKIYDVYGNLIEYTKIEEYSLSSYKISLPEVSNGLIFINLNNGEFVKKCIIY